nr:MAG: UDP-glucose 4-epimerase [actinobacterium acMicro-1]
MKKILVIGTGGLAREFTSYFSSSSEQIEIVGFSSTNHGEHSSFELPGVLFDGDVSPDSVGTDEAVIAIGSPAVKKRISEELKARGFTFPSFVHPSSVCSDEANLGEGVVVSPNCVISPNVAVNPFSYINFSCGVGHDAIIGSYVQINPGTQLGGGSIIGDGCLIGSGSTVLQGVQIGASATIGAGSVVFSRVAENATMMGNPAKRMRAFEK